MSRPNKNQRTALGNRNFMGHHEGDMLNTLPKYNYATGAGWKTGSCKGGSRKISFDIKRKRR